MSFLYNIAIQATGLALKGIAPFNEKIKKGVLGRKETFSILKQNINEADKTLWFHCASLGEYEQGLPVFKALRAYYKNHKIVLSFFSPSGYEIRKNSPIADMVVYLTLDSKKNANTFLDIVKPELTVFVKYDIWPNILNQLKKRSLRAILISAVFRKNQPYFKFYGHFFKQALFAFEYIFTQNDSSKTLLESINYKNVSVSGDTRFDRVSSQLELDNNLPYIKTFKDNKLCIVAGSTWPEGERLLSNFINTNINLDVKYIIAPHNIKTGEILNLKSNLHCKTVLFSEKSNNNLKEAKVFIVDTIGILSKIYNYADIAYVGGALGNTGLHNTLEPAIFGIPVIIGNNYAKFPEAAAMILQGGMFSVANQTEFNDNLNQLIKNEALRLQSGQKNLQYVKENKGAVIQILNYLRI
ncbi:3-deoxy-D-manno-octulosonic acid transferase [Tamlana sp. 62-3]|uniref:3-deoxy-D-manno-octulosonic acid transferase n=1 Tax=Neotamlana sargassicola TaxID=2883125 RepID=A0A9X1L355_9FLAO|nr:glycosyltransferase N-terminal domain-containing protein [Tamlana sargassicola]MCB4806737.1 3-deoxy-D-manno-octulosonic acid transferase [Tamlana sargassicola]